MERKKLNLPVKEANVLGKRKAEEGEAAEGKEGEAMPITTPFPSRKKKAKEPNPLSMRKPKKAKEQVGGMGREGQRKKKKKSSIQKESGGNEIEAS